MGKKKKSHLSFPSVELFGNKKRQSQPLLTLCFTHIFPLHKQDNISILLVVSNFSPTHKTEKNPNCQVFGLFRVFLLSVFNISQPAF